MECSWAPLSPPLQIVAKVLCSCLCSFDAIVELHVKKWKKCLVSNSHYKVNIHFTGNERIISSRLIFVYVVEESSYEIEKLNTITWVRFLAQRLVCIHLFFLYIVLYKVFPFIVTQSRHLGFQRRVHSPGVFVEVS